MIKTYVCVAIYEEYNIRNHRHKTNVHVYVAQCQSTQNMVQGRQNCKFFRDGTSGSYIIVLFNMYSTHVQGCKILYIFILW